jgi:hypothetical protein
MLSTGGEFVSGHEYSLDDVMFLVHTFTTRDLAAELLSAKYSVEKEVPIGGSRMRADILCGGNLVVEFDGPSHYTSAKTIASDMRKDDLCTKLGLAIARIPYFVQLDIFTASSLLITDDLPVETSFPHGWVTADVFPASFCEAGFDRFVREFTALPNEIQDSLLVSIEDNSSFHGDEVVMTRKQRAIIAEIVSERECAKEVAYASVMGS